MGIERETPEQKSRPLATILCYAFFHTLTYIHFEETTYEQSQENGVFFSSQNEWWENMTLTHGIKAVFWTDYKNKHRKRL